MRGAVALEKYRLLRALGRGSNAEVFLADTAERPGEYVVVKRVHPHVAEHPKFRQLFNAEVRSMANFSHPYAVQFIEASIDDPLGPCLVMEYVPGITLEALLQQERKLDIERVGFILAHCCHALQAAHDAGVIHRDLKPSNLMVTNVGTKNEAVKVMDFGFAGFAAKPHIQLAELTGVGPIYAMGTPAYVSPEMIRGDLVDHRSDLYSLGIILYEMLAGRLPFDDEYQEDLLTAHVRSVPPRFSKVGAGHVPPGIEGLVQLALSKYPNERQQSAHEMVDMYSIALGGDLWDQVTPAGWEAEIPIAEDITLLEGAEPEPEPAVPADPYSITHEFDAFMPERLVAAKLRGFVEDIGGQVLSSEPGMILLRVGVPAGYKEPPQAGSGILNWFRTIRQPSVTQGNEPIELELQLEKPNPSQPRLSVVAAFRPLKVYQPTNPRTWRQRCDKLHVMLRQYLGA